MAKPCHSKPSYGQCVVNSLQEVKEKGANIIYTLTKACTYGYLIISCIFLQDTYQCGNRVNRG